MRQAATCGRVVDLCELLNSTNNGQAAVVSSQAQVRDDAVAWGMLLLTTGSGQAGVALLLTPGSTLTVSRELWAAGLCLLKAEVTAQIKLPAQAVLQGVDLDLLRVGCVEHLSGGAAVVAGGSRVFTIYVCQFKKNKNSVLFKTISKLFPIFIPDF